MKADVVGDAGEELAGENRAERAVDVEIVPLEHGAERRSENNESVVLLCSDDAAVVGCHGCHELPLRLFPGDSRRG